MEDNKKKLYVYQTPDGLTLGIDPEDNIKVKFDYLTNISRDNLISSSKGTTEELKAWLKGFEAFGENDPFKDVDLDSLIPFEIEFNEDGSYSIG